jgi:hypothetical protein
MLPLREVPHHCLQQALVDLRDAFDRFCAGQSDYPRLHGKYNQQSFRFPDAKQIMIEASGDGTWAKLRPGKCRLQRGVSRKQRGSKKRAKRRRTLARHAAAIALRRKDALRQATTTRLRTHYYLASARFGVILDMAELERHVRVVFAE